MASSTNSNVCRLHWICSLFVISFVFDKAFSQSDVTLTCPEIWCSGKTTTLYCEVDKSSISKCGAGTPESTFFNLDPGSGSDIVCSVDSSDYSTCNYVLGSTPLDCGCQQNSSYYTFVYQFKADKNRHNGNWDCSKSCIAPSGPGNPLTKTISPRCTGVEVEDCTTPSGETDVTLTCPQNWRGGRYVTLSCEVRKASVASKCTESAPETTHFQLDNGSGVFQTQCSVGPSDYDSCNYILGSETNGCGCQQNSTHYKFVYLFNAITITGGQWKCEKACTETGSQSNPLTVYNSPHCSSGQNRVTGFVWLGILLWWLFYALV